MLLSYFDYETSNSSLISCYCLSRINSYFLLLLVGTPYGIVANILDFDIVVSNFRLHSHYYVHFWTHTLRKSMNVLIPSSYRLNSTTIRIGLILNNQ